MRQVKDRAAERTEMPRFFSTSSTSDRLPLVHAARGARAAAQVEHVFGQRRFTRIDVGENPNISDRMCRAHAFCSRGFESGSSRVDRYHPVVFFKERTRQVGEKIV